MTACSCGDPATRTVPVGHVRRGITWHQMWARMCDPCADEARRERAEKRAS